MGVCALKFLKDEYLPGSEFLKNGGKGVDSSIGDRLQARAAALSPPPLPKIFFRRRTMIQVGGAKEPMPRRWVCERMKHIAIPAPAFPASNRITPPIPPTKIAVFGCATVEPQLSHKE